MSGVLSEHAPLVAEIVDFHLTLAVNAHQNIVVLALDALLSDDVAGVELGRYSEPLSSASLTSPT